MHMTFRISLFDHSHDFSLSQPQRKTFFSHWHHDLTKPKLLFYRDRLIDRDRQFWIPMKHARHSTDITRTPGSVLINEDVIGSWFSSSVTSATPFTCIRITSFPTSDVAHKPNSPLRKSTQFCKSTTVKTVVLTHYMKLNTIRTILCSVKTDNSCCVQIYCIETYRITNTKGSTKQRNLLLQHIMAEVHTMFRVPIVSQTNPVYTPTWFNGKYEIEFMTVHPTDRRKNINCSGK